MARTKQAGRKGAAGIAGQKKHQAAKNQEIAAKQNKRQHDQENEGEISATAPPAKKMKMKAGVEQKGTTANTEGASDSNHQETNEPPQKSEKSTTKQNQPNIESLSLPSTLPELRIKHAGDIQTMSILSSSHIQKKVSRILNLLSNSKPESKSTIMVLHSKSKTAAKMISIVEIATRELEKEGVSWWQYCCVEGVIEERKEKKKEKKKGEKKDGGEEDSQDDDDREEEEESFEVMKTPFERAIEGKPKVRNVPLMSIFLARERVPFLKGLYREQTNAPKT